MTRLVVLRETPATLPGVAGLPMTALASEMTILVLNKPSVKIPAATRLHAVKTIRLINFIIIPLV
jgi:hypothetical protein